MTEPREPWNIRPAKKRPTVTASIKAEVESKARDLIENVLKPKHVLPPKRGEPYNDITDIGTKWYRNYFCFFSTYACPAPNALSPTFESMFARMEPLGDGKFALYAMRYLEIAQDAQPLLDEVAIQPRERDFPAQISLGTD